MNYWDMFPNDLQDNILQEKADKTLQRNFRRHPALRSKCLAKGCIDQWGGIHIICPWSAAALEYCAKILEKAMIHFGQISVLKF